MHTWLMFCLTEAVLSATPGPAVLMVTSSALRGGPRAGAAASAGVLAANLCYFGISATGLAAVLLASFETFMLIKWLGAAYLVWLGVRMLAGSFRGEAATAEVMPPSAHRDFAAAFVGQASNPKLLVFFVAVLPQFIAPDGSIAFQVTILAISSVVVEALVLLLYVLVAGRARRLGRTRFAPLMQRCGGVLLIAAGVQLARQRSLS